MKRSVGITIALTCLAVSIALGLLLGYLKGAQGDYWPFDGRWYQNIGLYLVVGTITAVLLAIWNIDHIIRWFWDRRRRRRRPRRIMRESDRQRWESLIRQLLHDSTKSDEEIVEALEKALDEMNDAEDP